MLQIILGIALALGSLVAANPAPEPSVPPQNFPVK